MSLNESVGIVELRRSVDNQVAEFFLEIVPHQGHVTSAVSPLQDVRNVLDFVNIV